MQELFLIFILNYLILKIQNDEYNINLSIDVINSLLNEKLKSNPTLEEIPIILDMMKRVNEQAGAIPAMLKKLEEAKQNLMYEKETEVSRGGQTVLSSMDAEAY